MRWRFCCSQNLSDDYVVGGYAVHGPRYCAEVRQKERTLHFPAEDYQHDLKISWKNQGFPSRSAEYVADYPTQ